MVVHLWGKYWMAAWRGGRTRVWVTGAIIFLVAVPTALTGYVSQQNFDAQWISTQAKDALNSVGVGAFFNVTNFGQMYSWHVLLLPVAVVAARRRPRAAGAQSRRRPAVRAGEAPRVRRGRRRRAGDPTAPPARRGSHEPLQPHDPPQGRHAAVERPLLPLRPRQRAVHRDRRDHAARAPADDPLLLPRRQAEHDRAVVSAESRGLHHGSGEGARRHQPHRRIRPPLQPQRQRPGSVDSSSRRNGSA